MQSIKRHEYFLASRLVSDGLLHLLFAIDPRLRVRGEGLHSSGSIIPCHSPLKPMMLTHILTCPLLCLRKLLLLQDGIKTGSELLDCGCGVGGPMRNIARFTGANVTGITINQYQVNRGNELNAQAGLKNQCKSIQGDFMRLPFPDNHFDGVYAIEATCHAPDRTKVFSEILRVLKPGQVFACYEWCLTDKYDKTNPDHGLIKKQIEEGDGLPDTAYTWEMDEALRKVSCTT